MDIMNSSPAGASILRRKVRLLAEAGLLIDCLSENEFSSWAQSSGRNALRDDSNFNERSW